MSLSMEGIAIEYFPISVDSDSNKKLYFNSYKSDDYEQDACYSHSNIINLFKKSS